MSQTVGGAPVAVVPLKALDQAKSRLAGHLGERRRRELTSWMFLRVVAACRASGVRGILVVAGDEAAGGLARQMGVEVVVEATPGLDAAMAAADRATAGAPASLVVAADLPLARGTDLDAVCRAGEHGPCVAVAPTRDGGTGALLRRPPDVITPAYGPDSAAAHLQAAARAGVRAVRVDVASLAWDIDTAEHLRHAGARDPRMAAWSDGLSAG